MLAGRKLLLADDSITIQKVVDLTFADEGVQVVSVSSGTEAIRRLEEISPDIVLADVFMPGMTGYQVCEYIKQNERLKHIPVLLLVGSFEPFDEAEARRVGADDILTKPFQSIRNLVDKVGELLRRQTVAGRFEKVSLNPPQAKTAAEGLSITDQEEVKTAELPKPEMAEEEPGKMDSGELELATADTLQLPPETTALTRQIELEGDRVLQTYPHREQRETATHFATEAAREIPLGYGDVLLDLGDFEPAVVPGADNSILDLGLDFPTPEISRAANVQTIAGVASQAEPATVVEEEAAWTRPVADTVEWPAASETSAAEPAAVWETAPSSGILAAEAAVAEEEVELPLPTAQHAEIESEPASATAAATPVGQITLDQLSPEVIDAIAHRAVELLSEKVVQEIAWEVVPQLAELLIKRRLEEKESQAN